MSYRFRNRFVLSPGAAMANTQLINSRKTEVQYRFVVAVLVGKW